MKTLPQDITDRIAGPVIEPTHLIEIELDEPMFLSTNGLYEWGSDVYTPGHIQKLRIEQSTVNFGLVNEGFQFTTPALSGVYHRAPVRVLWATGEEDPIPNLYVEPGYYSESYAPYDQREAPILLFEGNLSQFTQITSVLGVVATRSAARRFPTLRVLPPIANYVASEGAVIEFNGQSYRLEPRNK